MFQSLFFEVPAPSATAAAGAAGAAAVEEEPVAHETPPHHVLLEEGGGKRGAATTTTTTTRAFEMIIPTEETMNESSSFNHKEDKVPLLKSILNEMAGKEAHASMSPHRLMKAAKTLLYIALYMCTGPSLILLNKHILKDLDNGQSFNYPMFLSSLGLICSTIVAHVAVRLFQVELPNQARMTRDLYLKNVVPVGICQAGTLALGNAVYLHLTVSFIQMLKAFTPCMVMIVGVVSQVEVPERKIVLSVLGICLGTAMASYGELNFSAVGILIMLSAEFTEAIRLILVQKFLQSLKFGVLESQYFLAPAGAVCLMGASMLTEYPAMLRSGAFGQILAHPFLFFWAGTLGVGVHFLCFLVVQQTNSVTLKVLGTARNAMLVLFSVYVYGEMVSGLQVFGYTVSLSFFLLYSYLKAKKI